MENSRNNIIEHKAIIVAVVANTVMALAAYYFYYLTGSESLLLDGNFSFIAALVSMISVYLSKVKSKRTETFPFGLYLYESLFVFFKGLILLGIILLAVFQNVSKIIHYLKGDQLVQVTYGPILIYAISMSLICFGLAIFLTNRYRAANKESSILFVEAKSSILDGIISLALGLSFLFISWIDKNSPLAFFHSIGDSILVIVLSLLFLKTPLSILKNAFIEIGGGSIQDTSEREEIVSWLKEALGLNFQYLRSYINKTGSSYLAIIYLKSQHKSIDISELAKTKLNIDSKLKAKYNFTDIEIVLE